MGTLDNLNPEHFPIPITILTGFLGAGKTTLLNHILHGDHGLRLAVLVNDFGEVNIDAQLVVGVEGETVSLSNGCICCSIRGDLLKALLDIVARPEPPQYIIIETSGVSDPFTVAQTFQLPELEPLLELDSILTVMDAENFLNLSPEDKALAELQLMVADIVLLNKADLASAIDRARIQVHIRAIVPRARLVETTHARVPLELVLGVGNYALETLAQRSAQKSAQDVHVHSVDEAHDHDHDEHHHTDHNHQHDHALVYNTWFWQSDKPLSLERLREAIIQLPATIYRAKGILWLHELSESMAVLQVVGKRAQLHVGDTWQPDVVRRSQMVFIGSYGGVNKAKLEALLASCAIDATEKLWEPSRDETWLRNDADASAD